MRKFITMIVFLAGSSLSLTTRAWNLVADESNVSFISIKKNNIGESHIFTDIAGEIKDGQAIVTIKPDSVDSRVPIRDERMRKFLFETKLYPTIDITAPVADILDNISTGDSKVIKLTAIVSMHGQSLPIESTTRVSALSKDKITVTSIQPVLIRAANFEMVEGIQKLSSLVNGLPIAESIPVSFSVTFSK